MSIFSRVFLLGLSSLSGLLLSGSLWAQNLRVLRDPATPCGFYLSKRSEDTKGTLLVEGLNSKELAVALAQQHPLDTDSKLYIVGAPFHSKEVSDLETQVHEVIRGLGYKGVDVTTVRRLASWLADSEGLWVRKAYGPDSAEWIRLSGADPHSLRKAFASGRISSDSELLLVGAPVLTGDLARYRGLVDRLRVRSGMNSNQIEVRTALQAGASKVLADPAAAFTYLSQRFQTFWPIKEDYQKPTLEENRSALQKLVVPGVLTASVMLGQGQALQVLIPTTLVNAGNSFLTGTYRTLMGNWLRRSQSVFPERWLKDVALSVVFTSGLYWLGNPSNAAQILEGAAWQTFLASKWLTILFNSSWRSPNNSLVFNWERDQVARGADARQIRHSGAAIQKYTSYIMTQFFIYSIVTDQALFKVVQGADGLDFLSAQAATPEGATLLMAFNVGHAAMAFCGLSSCALLAKTDLLTPVARGMRWLDQWESRLFSWILRLGRSKAGGT